MDTRITIAAAGPVEQVEDEVQEVLAATKAEPFRVVNGNATECGKQCADLKVHSVGVRYRIANVLVLRDVFCPMMAVPLLLSKKGFFCKRIFSSGTTSSFFGLACRRR